MTMALLLLLTVEPGEMWNFETDFDSNELNRPGKLLKIIRHIPSNNFVPGDWAYLVNTDRVSSQRAGYEGSNAVYLGRGRFDDYYNDNDNAHFYTFKQKLEEVYQWRNGVFDRSQDFLKIRILSENEIARLMSSPEQGGVTADFRVVPYYFGTEMLPTLDGSSNVTANSEKLIGLRIH